MPIVYVIQNKKDKAFLYFGIFFALKYYKL